jgi:hypothetical protein
VEPFSLTCTTCQARLKILDAATIGQIHSCPRCGGMVKIVAPTEAAKSAKPASTAKSPVKDEKNSTPTTTDEKPSSLTDIAAQVATVANETPVVAPAEEADSFLSDPRIVWVCAPVAAVLIGLIIWSSLQESAPADGDESLQVATISEPAKNAVTPPVVTPPAASKTDAATAPKTIDKPTVPALPPLVTPPAVVSPAVEPKPAMPPAITPAVPTPPATMPAVADKTPAKKSDPPVSTPPATMPPVATKTPVKQNDPPAMPPKNDEPAPVELTKPDLESLLKSQFERVEFASAPLETWLRFVSRATTIPIGYDADDLVDHGTKLDQPLTIKKYNLTAQELLKAVLGDVGLDFVVEDFQLRITRVGHDPVKLVVEKHSTAAFMTETPDQLGDLTRALIDPETWIDADGQGTLKVEGRDLVVEQTPTVQRGVRRLLKVLHQLRDKSYAETPRFQRAAAKLNTLVKVNFPGPTPLLQVIDYLQKQYGVIILIDHTALAAEQKTAQLTASLVAQDLPLGAALTTLLEPLGLVMRVVDANVIEITTPDGAEQNADLEFYPLGKLLVPGEPADAVIRRVAEQLPGVNWRSTGGRGALGVDSTTGYLIVRHSQQVQRRVVELLAK